jgi:hypothetical protein
MIPPMMAREIPNLKLTKKKAKSFGNPIIIDAQQADAEDIKMLEELEIF